MSITDTKLTREPRLLKPRQVARHYNVEPRTVVRWINEGKMRGVKVGRVWRIPEDHLNDMVRDGS